MGGKCCVCEYSKCNRALALHHLNPSEKEFSISDCTTKPKSWSKIVSELKKCILVCHNCHSEIHAGVIAVPLAAPKFKEIILQNVRKKNICLCGKIIDRVAKKCGKCYAFSMRRVERPSAEELKKLVWSHPTTKVAAKFGVSSASIQKWCKSLGVKKPPRGYWTKMHS